MRDFMSVYICNDCKGENHINKDFQKREIKFCPYCGSDNLSREDHNYWSYEWKYIKEPSLKEPNNHEHKIDL